MDFEIIVLTYNRAPLIAATLESLLAQTLPASRICVFDNGSTDETGEVVKSFVGRGVELVTRNSNDPRACWPELQAMARGPWTMLFHDDDLLHPDYLRDVSAALSLYPETTVVVSAMRVHRDPEHAPWGNISGKHYVSLTGQQLAARLYSGFPMPFCSAIYRTDVLKRGNFNLDTFGKIGDRPFVIEAARKGSALAMLDPYVKYRIHARQDSSDQATGPFLPEIFALQRYYREVLGENFSDFPGQIFLRRNYNNLLREFNRLNQRATTPITQEAFFHEALVAGAASNKSLRIGRWYAAMTHIPKKVEIWLKTNFRRKS